MGPGTKVSYLTGTTRRTGEVWLVLGERALIARDGTTTTQDVLPLAALTQLDTAPPAAPAGLAVVAGDQQASLSWQPSTDDVGVVGYRVYRDGTQVGAPVAPSWLDAGLLNGRTYLYEVRAVDAAGNLSLPSAGASATPALPPPPPPPPPPAGFRYFQPFPRLAAAVGAQVWVDPAVGLDTNPGTEAKPLKTLAAGIAKAAPGDEVMARAAVYRETLRLAKNGDEGHVTWIRGVGGRAVIQHVGSAGSALDVTGSFYALKDVECIGSARDIAGGPVIVYIQRTAHHLEFIDSPIHGAAALSSGYRWSGLYVEHGAHHVAGYGDSDIYDVDALRKGTPQLCHCLYMAGSDFYWEGDLRGAANGYGAQIYDSNGRAQRNVALVSAELAGNGRSGLLVARAVSDFEGVALRVHGNGLMSGGSQVGIQGYSQGSVAGARQVVRDSWVWGNAGGPFSRDASSPLALDAVTYAAP